MEGGNALVDGLAGRKLDEEEVAAGVAVDDLGAGRGKETVKVAGAGGASHAHKYLACRGLIRHRAERAVGTGNAERPGRYLLELHLGHGHLGHESQKHECNQPPTHEFSANAVLRPQ